MSVIDVKAPARLVPLDTAFNLRDLGGYPTVGGPDAWPGGGCTAATTSGT